jgi:hypothetical protein
MHQEAIKTLIWPPNENLAEGWQDNFFDYPKFRDIVRVLAPFDKNKLKNYMDQVIPAGTTYW